MTRRLVIGTSNSDKAREIQAVLEGAGYELVGLDRFAPIDAAEENGRTFDDNARIKARHYANATGELVVAEDSGLEVDALGGAPGVESARYGGAQSSYPQKFARLYEALRVRRKETSAARFVCAVALARDDRILFETRAAVEGRIAPVPRGSGGFGYDPIFFYPPYGCTFGEASAERKAAVSHRGQAFRALRDFLVTMP